jgi:hypothetical protein
MMNAVLTVKYRVGAIRRDDNMSRNKDGTFATGNPGGPGRPRRSVEKDYMRTLAETCPPDVWQEICLAAVRKAKLGDPVARAWLSKYVMGEMRLSGLLTEQERLAMMVENID